MGEICMFLGASGGSGCVICLHLHFTHTCTGDAEQDEESALHDWKLHHATMSQMQ